MEKHARLRSHNIDIPEEEDDPILDEGGKRKNQAKTCGNEGTPILNWNQNFLENLFLRDGDH